MTVFHSGPCVFPIRSADSRLVVPCSVEQCGTCGFGKAETYRSGRQAGGPAKPCGPQPCTCSACQSTESLISAVDITAEDRNRNLDEQDVKMSCFIPADISQFKYFKKERCEKIKSLKSKE